MVRRLMWSVVCALLLPVGATAVAGAGDARPATIAATASADSPTVIPATGGAGVPFTTGMFTDVGAVGYQTSEFFVSGDAHSYGSDTPLTSDGRWNVEPDPATAAYTTRVLAFTPQDPRKFNGTVYVEWFNVSGGLDASPDWTHGHLQMVREGAAYVGVSAQAAGVNQLKSTGFPAPGDPVRYASLSHPGDSYSYDIYSQAAQAIHDGNVLGDLVPRRLVGVGESQSAGRLVTYIDAVHPLVDVLDGFLVHSRGRGGAALSQAPLPLIEAPLPTAIRTDSRTPVIVFQAETDVANSLLQARQDETRNGRFRLWEVAGTAHFDSYGLTIGPSRHRRRPRRGPCVRAAAEPHPEPATRSHRVRPADQRRPAALGDQLRGALDQPLGEARHTAPDRTAPASHHATRGRPCRLRRPMRTATRSGASARPSSTCRSPRSPAPGTAPVRRRSRARWFRRSAASARSSARPSRSTTPSSLISIPATPPSCCSTWWRPSRQSTPAS